MEAIVDDIETTPERGDNIGNNCYKIRISIVSKNKGKSGGARLIIHVQYSNDLVYMLSIYDKSEQNTVSESEIKQLLKYIP